MTLRPHSRPAALIASLALGGALLVPTAPAVQAESVTSDESAFTVRQLAVLDSGSGEGGAEIAAYDTATRQIAATNGVEMALDIYDVATPTAPTRVARLDLSSYGDEITSVAARNGIAVVGVPKATTFNAETGVAAPQRGTAVIVNLTTRAVADSVEVGFLPDGIAFSPDGSKAIVANEGQPECAQDVDGTPANESTDASLLVDPSGSISIIDVATPTDAQVSEVGFSGIRVGNARQRGIIIRAGATAAQDFEPEYPAVSPDGTTAYVSLQENNAIAVVDLVRGRLVRVVSAGFTDRGDVPFDPSDRDSLRAPNRTFAGVLGMRQPDALSAFAVDGRTYFASANEGDAREYTCLNDDVRASTLTVDSGTFPDWATWRGNTQLGRLKVTNAAGDVDGDGDIDVVLARGSRSMTIYDRFGNEVADTAAAIEEWYAANSLPAFNGQFNASGGNVTWAADDRSDDKGPEPEGVSVGVVGAKTVAFVGLERTNAVALFDVTDPESPNLDDIVEFSDPTYAGPAAGLPMWSPEGLQIVAAADSPTGRPMLVTTFELSGTIALHEVVERVAPAKPTAVQGEYTGGGSASFTWVNPSEVATGLDQLGSTVACQSGTDTPLIVQVEGTASSATLTGLSAGLRYACTVSARNVEGVTASDPVTLDALKMVNLLNFNDFHGRIDTNTVKFAGTIEQQRAEYGDDRSLVLSNGDSIGATVFASASQGDLPTIEVLNALELDVSAVGNHEFDAGFANLTGAIAEAADFEYLGANVYLKGTTTPALPEYATFDVDGVTVGVIGAVTADTPTLVVASGVATLDFGDPVTAVNRVAAQLSDGNAANGEADVIVAEYHEGAANGSSTSTLEAEVAAGGVFARIVNETSPLVDVIFNGHSHKVYAWEGAVQGGTRPIVQAGQYGENIAQVVVGFNEETEEVDLFTSEIVARTTVSDSTLKSAYPRVSAVGVIVDAALAEAAIVGSQAVGSVTADITTAFSGDRRDDRASESTLGNLVADALLDALDDEYFGGADFGVVNPGGLRAELYRGDDGVVTYAEANAVLPFLNNLWTTTLTGAQVKVMLEQQWQRDPNGNVPSRAFLRLGLSSNFSYTFDPARPEGDDVSCRLIQLPSPGWGQLPGVHQRDWYS